MTWGKLGYTPLEARSSQMCSVYYKLLLNVFHEISIKKTLEGLTLFDYNKMAGADGEKGSRGVL